MQSEQLVASLRAELARRMREELKMDVRDSSQLRLRYLGGGSWHRLPRVMLDDETVHTVAGAWARPALVRSMLFWRR